MRDSGKDGPSPLCPEHMAGYFYPFSGTLVSHRVGNASSLNLIALTQREVPCINIFPKNSGNNKIAVAVPYFRATRLQMPHFPVLKLQALAPKCYFEIFLDAHAVYMHTFGIAWLQN